MSEAPRLIQAIIRIPREIHRLTKTIAILGETLIDNKIEKTRQNKRDFKTAIDQHKNAFSKSVVPNQKNAPTPKNPVVVPKKK